MSSHELAKPRLITIVVNERSGGGRAGRVLPKVARSFREGLPTAELNIIRPTSYIEAENATRLAAATAQQGDALVVLGGDGMAHLGLNACAHSEAILGIIPAGTGNDFARAIGVPKSIREAVQVVIAGNTRVVDLSLVSNERYSKRYVGAVVSSGYDARVNRATNDIQLRFGALSYGWIALRELANFEPLEYRLQIDGVVRDRRAMLIAVCNTGIFGGGMHIGPGADPADGLLDITVIDPVSRGTLLRLLPQMYSGKFIRHPAVQQLRAREVAIDGEGLFAMGDGEELGEVPVTVKVDPGALRVFVAS